MFKSDWVKGENVLDVCRVYVILNLITKALEAQWQQFISLKINVIVE